MLSSHKVFIPSEIVKEYRFNAKRQIKKHAVIRSLTVSNLSFSDGNAKIAVLIDADNTPTSYITGLFDEISKQGTPVVKRCYGDFSKNNLSLWRETALRHAISTEQQFAYTSGKNATDIRLVIDAMDMLYSPQFDLDVFLIVSSDSDFAPLASRLRMAGKKVYAAGQRKTPQGFRNSVDQFIILETLRKEEDEYEILTRLSSSSSSSSYSASPSTSTEHGESERGGEWSRALFSENVGPEGTESLEEVQALISNVAEDLQDTLENITLAGFLADDTEADMPGWVYLRSMARLLGRRSPGFSSKNYGLDTLEALIDEVALFEKKKVYLMSESGKKVRHLVVKFKPNYTY
mmetsp:Transcript_7281/g.9837  ORF Transcript_7281/g.9837 Transcript_7281/m.9837 type:complete len:348 (+) Transcript_7281:156-1199(+)|eukprot:CAMPEP_0196575258 /NCGR_PEP_ID=MMETSP1081-20130531/4775_1 /TAXON_ID=36882 /ORGANISM="Pyramimonas amylifera, Strain CCMP720" /LENGTH=347 /DNA_ID=CAMNT_0041893511 /DNA_START=153 /DNA_END=1196 /DNA_ORIENTATION=+